MNQRSPWLSWLLALVAGACGTSAEGGSEPLRPAPEAELTSPAALGPDWNVAAGDSAGFVVAWRARDGGAGSRRIPRNQAVTLDVLLFRADELYDSESARLSVRGWMPDHEHGLVRIPRITPEGAGRFTVEGLLLHMRGHWQLFFNVTDGTVDDTAAFEIDL